MAPKRSFDNLETDGGSSKRNKNDDMPRGANQQQSDPKKNPYLAHMYGSDEEDEGGIGINGNGYGSNGHATRHTSQFGSTTSSLEAFQRHKTTSAQAARAEDGPHNPFTGTSLSQKYFDILRTRRNLPVHAQRYGLLLR